MTTTDKPEPDTDAKVEVMHGEGRQSAVDGLQQEINHHRHIADTLAALRDALPRRLPEPADHALWQLLMNQRR